MILITRPLQQSLKLQKFLGQHKLSAHINSLLTIVPRKVNWPDISNYAALITTSARSIEIIGKTYSHLSLPIWCVGKESAKVAKELGYTTFISQQENALSLIEDLKKTYCQKKDRLLYISGAVTSVKLETILGAFLFKCDRLVVYDSVMSSNFKTCTLNLFAKEKIKIVLFYSKQAAKSFKLCMEKSKINLSLIIALCKSEKIHKEIQVLNWKKSLYIKNMTNKKIVKICQQLNNT